MKGLMGKILKIALYVLLAVLVILVVFGLVLWLDWPIWVGLFLLIALAAVGIGLLFLWKILLRQKEQRFVQQVIEQDEARIRTLSVREQDEMKILQDRWKDAVAMLKRSHLRKLGNPLYVLPWYMVIGESGSGKTTAINSAKLSSPFAEVKRVQGISGTKNCEWWFFEQAVILDTAGRYAIPVDEGKDKEEWQKFLGLLLKYRRKEPLHGLIVTIPADKLLAGSHDSIEDDGKSIRRRIDELMRALGIKFPVYVLVTKCDLIQGMTKFADELPEKVLDQPMGYVNQNLSKDVSAFLDAAFKSIGERLRNVRLLLLHEPRAKSADPGMLLFPEEFEQLKRGLDGFMKAAFQENPYQETPFLRGIFFSSGHQEGTPYSHFLEALGLIDQKQVLPVSSKGLFLHEFFSKVLPSDRLLFAPTTRAVEWQRVTRNLGLCAWILLAVAVCGLLSLSFVKNLNSIRSVTRELAQPVVVKGEFLTDVVTMERFRQAIVKLERENSHWWIPRFGLKESVNLEMGLKERFCKQFHDLFLGPFDKGLQEAMPRLISSSGGSEEVAGQYIVHLVRRINLLKARLEGVTFEKLNDVPQPSYVSLLSTNTGSPEVRKKFGSLYLSYITWQNDTVNITKEIALLQSWLKDLLASRGGGLQWLVGWVEKESGFPVITLGDFWGGTLTLPDEPVVRSSFTVKGKRIIDGFLKELEGAIGEAAFVETQRADFDKRYRAAAFENWRAFVYYFPKGANRLKGAREWRQMASRMATDQGAYAALVDRITTELEPIITSEDTPAWAQQIFHLKMAKTQGLLKDQGAVAKAAEHGKKLVATIEKKVGGETEAGSMDAQIAAGKAYQEMTAALGSAAPAVSSRGQAYQLAAQVFTEEPSASKSPFYLASAAASRLRAAIGWGRPSDEAVSRLIGGPIDFIWATVRMDAGCYVQSTWEEKVLAEAQGASGTQAAQMLLAPDGPVWKFVKSGGAAAPFIGWNLQRGYYAKEVLGGNIPFDPSFFPFLVKGAKTVAAAQQAKQNYSVSITGLPTGANQDARVKPHATKLELQCAAGVQSLANMNFPIKKTFTWAPESCGDVTFQVEVGNLVLTKHYGGNQGFPDFLRDFRGGRHVFNASEFPQDKPALDGMGIKFIEVNYQFSGDGPVVGQAASASPGQVARTITRCWAD